MYGITETTVHVSHLELSSADVDNPASTVGRAIPGLGIYVLDARLQPVPVGVPGEIYVRGGQLARGYLGRAELTSGRFVADPYGAPGSRMYRTGDVARWNAHGQLEYAGRSDLQVQLRGFRIELGEIEAALTGVEGVAHAVASVWSDEHTGEKLVGYVVPRAGHTVAPSEVLERVGEFLTGYMVPDAVLVLDELPLTPNGKLDRRSLPEPVFTSDREFRAPRTPTEETIAEVFADVLGLERVGLDDSFFALGGDSIVSIQLVSRAKARGVVFTRARCSSSARWPVSPKWRAPERDPNRCCANSKAAASARSRSPRSCGTWSSVAAVSTATRRPSHSNCPPVSDAATSWRRSPPWWAGTTCSGHACGTTVPVSGCCRPPRREVSTSTRS